MYNVIKFDSDAKIRVRGRDEVFSGGIEVDWRLDVYQRGIHTYMSPDPHKGYWEEGDRQWEWREYLGPPESVEVLDPETGQYKPVRRFDFWRI